MLSAMPHQLPVPNWANVIGGDEESRWLADRDRKINIILELSGDVLETARRLNKTDHLFSPTPEILLDLPFSIEWYTSLAGFSLKTLGNITDSPRSYGIKRKITTIRNNLVRNRSVPFGELVATAKWLKDQIEIVWPLEGRSVESAIVTVGAILGGRAIGQGQNAGGNDAVLLLKGALVGFAEQRGLLIEGRHENSWRPHTPDNPALLCNAIRLDKIEARFFTGGDTPDVTFHSELRAEPLAVGEVKGRKDTSNVWESWMPQVVDHMNTWSREFRRSWRLFFGTLINAEMIRGESVRGTWRMGLRALYDEGHLNGVYNLSLISIGDEESLRSFYTLMDAVMECR